MSTLERSSYPYHRGRAGVFFEHNIHPTHAPMHAFISHASPSEPGPMGPTTFDPKAQANKIYKFVVGRSSGTSTPLTREEINDLQDPFVQNILADGIFPLTADQLVTAAKKIPGSRIEYFLIAENGQIDWSVGVEKTPRLVVVVSVVRGIGPDILLSTGTETDSESHFLQVMSWDKKAEAFNFYQRSHKLWIFSGNGFDALSSDTRNKGPFSGHVNGGMIMKELHRPWQNWNSSAASIHPSAFEPNDPFLNSDYFKQIGLGDVFENYLKSGANIWNKSRISHAIIGNKIAKPLELFRQIFETTNRNLISSTDSSQGSDASVALPTSFFLNLEAFTKLGIIPSNTVIVVPRTIYQRSLKNFNLHLSSKGVKIPGDTHFAFFVPEVAYEDNNLLKQLFNQKVISSKLAACILMTDYKNPIDSFFRTSLQQYVPETVTLDPPNVSDFDIQFIAAVTAAAERGEEEAASQFLNYWKITTNDGWEKAFEAELTSYLADVQEQCNRQEGFDAFMKLADLRRQRFRETGLFEFDLTFPTIPPDPI